jgi:hypothetical protein
MRWAGGAGAGDGVGVAGKEGTAEMAGKEGEVGDCDFRGRGSGLGGGRSAERTLMD